MATKPLTQTQEADRLEYFPDYPPRDDMQNWTYLHESAVSSTFASYLDRLHDLDVFVGSEVPIRLRLPSRGNVRIPDLMAAFNVDRALITEQRGYEIARHGKAPEFVLEVASPTTGVVDYTAKRRDYERFGVSEYFRFDPSGGEYHDAPLAGDRLTDGLYEPIPLEMYGDGYIRGYSEALGLYLCWENEELRFYDPVAGKYISTLSEIEEELAMEAARADRETARADAAEARRLEDVTRAEARAAAEATRADRAETRLAELEAEIRRLRGE